ncbi:hypothetical protein PSH58_03375 [Pseudomonas hefeiensis]|uniref:hypothetical protein n=1 Tax=Pseudomonas hefeiensis TaxID=2738125 RepID=UPI0027377A40|nr:hypothetical protein [Pseudomonas sp. FP53]WLH96476.1 hypothetical protein PSH58_03375 [Pseudomonas sp. FP53]
MDENFEEDRFHEIVLAYTSGRASIKDLEEYADSLKNTEERERATASFFDVLDFTNFHYNGPRAVQGAFHRGNVYHSAAVCQTRNALTTNS